MKSSIRIAVNSLLAVVFFLGCVGQQSGEDLQPATTQSDNTLYISNFADSSLLVYDNALSANGNIAPTQRIPNLAMASSGVFVDANSDPDANAGNGTGVLYVGNPSRNEILVFNNASAIDGNSIPDRIISGVATTLNAPRGLAVDTTQNILYVSNAGSNTILAFDVSNAAFTPSPICTVNGSTTTCNLTPTHTVTGLTQPWGLFVDETNNRLYVANAGGNSILVFNSASTINGSTLPDRTVTFSNNSTTLPLPRLSGPSSLFVANNRLYVANNGNNSILIFDSADIIDGETTPNRAVSGGQTNLSSPAGVSVDTGNILYVTASNNAILVFNNASTVNGDVAPSRTISGTATTFSSPSGIYVDTANNRLYAANPGNGSIVVFNNASTATGNIAPDRTVLNSGVPLLSQGSITGDVTRDLLYVAETGSIFVLENASTMQNSPPPVVRTVTMTVPLFFTFAVSIDASRDRLYAATATSVLAFNNASTLTGSPSPDSTIGGLVTPVGLFVDSTRDLLYVSDQGTNSIKVFEQAGTTPTLLHTISGVANPRAVAMDTVNDILYVSTLSNSILVYDQASIKDGAVSPDRTIAGSMTMLSLPFGIFVDETNDLLYVANTASDSVVVFDDASTATGNIAPSRVISQGAGLSNLTTLNSPIGIFVDTTR